MLAVVLALVLAAPQAPTVPAPQPAPSVRARLQVFLDCKAECFDDYLREEIEFVDWVRDRENGDVHVLVTSTTTGGGGREYSVQMMGLRTFAGRDQTLKAITETGDPEDVRRRQLLTTVKVGLLHYLSRDGVPQQLTVDIELEDQKAAAGARRDPWNNWVFAIEGSVDFSGEESQKDRQLTAEFSADRITPNWKITFGLEIDQEREEFDLDEDEPVTAVRSERDFNWLIVKSLGEHWSAGARGEITSSTFDNTELRIAAAPAIEFNFFPYSAYQRRQLRTNYAIGVTRQSYHEETLYGKLEETLPLHELSVTYDQTERWGSVQGRVQWSQYLHDLSKNRLETNGEISWRILRGLSINADGSASRIRDQISLRRRGATDEEILLRLRELQSGYEYSVSMSVRYTFGSIFSAIVNPRFGQ